MLSIYTVCPTRYRTRHFFNNSNTNEDITTKFEQEYVRCVRNEKECVCSVPNCCDTEQRSASQPGLVASGSHYVCVCVCIYIYLTHIIHVIKFIDTRQSVHTCEFQFSVQILTTVPVYFNCSHFHTCRLLVSTETSLIVSCFVHYSVDTVL